MTIKEMILKYRIRRTIRGGQRTIQARVAHLTSKEIEMIKNSKQLILNYLDELEEQTSYEIVSGERKIKFNRGIDTGAYHPSVEVPEELWEEWQDILQKAIERIVGKRIVFPCDYITSQLGDRGQGERFEMTLSEILNPTIEKIEKKKEEEKKAFEKAATTGEPILLREYTVECNDPYLSCTIDNIKVYAMPDGCKKEIRIHNF